MRALVASSSGHGAVHVPAYSAVRRLVGVSSPVLVLNVRRLAVPGEVGRLREVRGYVGDVARPNSGVQQRDGRAVGDPAARVAEQVKPLEQVGHLSPISLDVGCRCGSGVFGVGVVLSNEIQATGKPPAGVPRRSSLAL